MSISAVNSIAFKGNTQTQQPKRSGGAVPAVGSFLVPGLGHFMNGDNKKGAKFLGGAIGLGAVQLASLLGCFKLNDSIAKKGLKEVVMKDKALGAVAMAAAVASSVGFFVLRLADVVKAYQGEQPKEVQEAETVKVSEEIEASEETDVAEEAEASEETEN